MGLDIKGARFLLGEKSRGVHFGHTLTLGRQGIYLSGSSYSAFIKMLGTQVSTNEYADDFFHGLGARPLAVMDASNYEGAGIIHDLNEPVDPQYHSAFDTVIDGGTLEHVFNFPVAIRNCMEMVKPGGQLILMSPWHNYPGHGFYEFSPELFHNTLSPHNGFSVERMLVDVEGHWYSVRTPAELKQRVEISTRDQVLLYITARKLASCPVFASWPQQSDYSAAWDRGDYTASAPEQMTSFKSRLVKNFSLLENLQSKWQSIKYKRSISLNRNPGFVRICASHEIPKFS